ncbi:MAG: peptidoglycan DD-metalloendopeptidase family protein [Salinivirgaceae bacterium]|nr:peptidoglycan DD-metalloendopeptidase family protein [Salinivirgaceae bacterium]
MNELEKVLRRNQDHFTSIMKLNVSHNEIHSLDLSANNKELDTYTILDTENLANYIHKKLIETQTKIAIGGYAEDRIIYKKSTHFGLGENVRSIHLGIDVWCDENTIVHAPLNGIVHSFKINNNFGDYGPTIILEHKLEGIRFYTLYGHLATDSLKQIQIGDIIPMGNPFAQIGTHYENGNWPPHLHFQIISEMENNFGDFPGVCSKKELNKYLALCPNPALLFNI